MNKKKEDEIKQESKIQKEKNETQTKKEPQKTQQKEKIQQKTDTQETLLQTEKDKYMRLFAEFENYKKRTSKERIELFQTAGKEVLKDLLPVLDDFDRAFLEFEKNKCDKELLKGVKLIHEKLKKTLKTKGLEEMKVQKGADFNADFHEAITQIPAPEENLKGKIIDIVEKGYKIADTIIRYPKVVIGQK